MISLYPIRINGTIESYGLLCIDTKGESFDIELSPDDVIELMERIKKVVID